MTNPQHEALVDLTRPIIGIENRTAQEVFDIMADRVARKFSAIAALSVTAATPSDEVVRLRAALESAQPYVAWFRDNRCEKDGASWEDADYLDREIASALAD